jgi:GNAT superfamily N-acetyltransferase
MTLVRPARASDGAAIAAVHVASWRSAYPGMVPDRTLTHLSPSRQEVYYSRLIRTGHIVHVAEPPSEDPSLPSVIGFVTAGIVTSAAIAEGEIETLYVLDDFREQGVGRALLRAAAYDWCAWAGKPSRRRPLSGTRSNACWRLKARRFARESLASSVTQVHIATWHRSPQTVSSSSISAASSRS